MMQKTWKQWVTGLVLIGGLSAAALAQDVATQPRTHGRPMGGFAATLDRQVGLTPEQKDSVRGLLAEQRQKSQAMRDETDKKIRALLNPAQQTKFDALLAEQASRRSKNRSNR